MGTLPAALLLSGTYAARDVLPLLAPAAGYPAIPDAGNPRVLTFPLASSSGALDRVVLRLDVDGEDPLNVASGEFHLGGGRVLYWVAPVAALGNGMWRGTADYAYGFGSDWCVLDIVIEVASTMTPAPRAKLAVTARGLARFAFELPLVSRSFRKVHVQIDTENAKIVAPLHARPYEIDGHHPDEAEAGLPADLSLQRVWALAGIGIRHNAPPVVMDAAKQQEAQKENGWGKAWTDDELHAAMELVWRPFGEAQFQDIPRWALWVFFADQYKQANTLGVMFDSELGCQRQGAAVFHEAFTLLHAPNAGWQAVYGEGQQVTQELRDQWTRRHKFFTLVHEMGHAFNLAHSFAKTVTVPWRPLVDEPDACSFMNYPCRGPLANALAQEAAFFEKFLYRFSTQELLFLRHAPEPFVQMGNEAWGSQHAYALAETVEARKAGGELRLTVARARPVYDFLEPVYLDVTLTNRRGAAMDLDPGALSGGHGLVLLIRRDGAASQRLSPLVRRCELVESIAPDGATFGSALASVGGGDWLIAEPGVYTCQAFLSQAGEILVSNILHLRVLRPRNSAQDRYAADYFSQAVGHILGLQGGSAPSLSGGLDTLQELLERPELNAGAAARHAVFALNWSRTRAGKRMVIPDARTLQGRPWREVLAARVIQPAGAVEPQALERIAGVLGAEGTIAFGRVESTQRRLLLQQRLRAQGGVQPFTELMHAIAPELDDPLLADIRRVLEARLHPTVQRGQ